MPKSIGIFLLEDRAGALADVEQTLLTISGLVIVGRFLSSHENVVAEVARMKPQLVLMDLAGPALTGVKALQEMKTLLPTPMVVVLSDHDHPHFHAAAKALGADASLARATFPADLLPLILQLFRRDI